MASQILLQNFLEIIVFKKLTGNLMALGFYCSIQTADSKDYSGYLKIHIVLCLPK